MITPKLVIAIAAAVAIVAIAAYFLFFKPFNIVMNGDTYSVKPGTTIAALVEEGPISPNPGDFVAVDKSVITKGAGEPFSARINGEKAAADTRLQEGMVVEIGNGENIMEDFTTSEEPLPFETFYDDRDFSAYWNASIHLMQDGKDGVRITKTGVVSGKTATEDNPAAIPAGYHTYTAQPSDKVIALTFDDGPWPTTTDQILDILEQYNAKATFFTIGNQIAEHPEAVLRAKSLGCEVCTHSWDHADGSGGGTDLTKMSPDEQIEEITRGYKAIADVTGEEPPHIIRAPGGNFHDDIIDTLWPYVDAEIGWDNDTEDWSLPGVDAIVSQLLAVEPGHVVLMHDGGGDRAQTVEALKIAMPTLVERGYSFVTISELLAYGAPAAGQGGENAETAEA